MEQRKIKDPAPTERRLRPVDVNEPHPHTEPADTYLVNSPRDEEAHEVDPMETPSANPSTFLVWLGAALGVLLVLFVISMLG